jgi:N-hydroxyarylamine O-acetyltransferase
MDIDDYLERIDAGPAAPPSPAALAALHERHMYTVPLENLDVHRGVPLSLDQDHILDKIVRRRRGGLCFELNAAFAWLLRNLGYHVTLLAGDVAKSTDGFGISGGHMLLRVEFGADEPPYLADVGFGDGFVRPLPHVSGAITEEAELRYRAIAADDGAWLLQRDSTGSDDFETRFRFTTTPRTIGDFEHSCTYHQSSPSSVFTQRLTCTRATPEGRVMLFSNRLVRIAHGRRTEAWVRGEAGRKRALRQYFGIVLGPDPE